MVAYSISTISNKFCDLWIGHCEDPSADYFYGGTRMVPPDTVDEEVNNIAVRLMKEESHLKNRLINRALSSDLLSDCKSDLPAGYLNSRVGGARCIMRPKTDEIYAAMSNSDDGNFSLTVAEVFKDIGAFLDRLNGKVKLTPDFGKFHGFADILYQYSRHVLGIRCADGGCGGKASYTVAGIMSVMKELDLLKNPARSCTLIGADGALGSGVLEHLSSERFKNLAVADLKYDDGSSKRPEQYAVLPSVAGAFADECLTRGGLIVAATHGGELARSNWKLIPPDTDLVLAHNMSLDPGRDGIQLAREMQNRKVFVVPGQLLTLGGALTSRLENYWRESHSNQDFTPLKLLAHRIVWETTRFLTSGVLEVMEKEKTTPFEAMWKMAEASV